MDIRAGGRLTVPEAGPMFLYGRRVVCVTSRLRDGEP